ncbi:kinesin-like protein, partial [Spiromyces aspiralis]
MRGTTASISKGSEQTQNAGSVASVLPQQQASLASNAPRREYGDVDSGGDQLNPFRYSRDFILGLFKQTDIPIDFKEHDIVTRKEAKPPMGLKPMTEEESKAFKGPVNSNLSRRPPQHHHSHHQGRHHHISNNNNNNNNNSSSSSINNNIHYQSTTLGTRTRPRGTYPHGGMSKDGLAGSTDDMAREIGLRDSFSKYTDPTASISLEDEGPNLWAGVNIRRNMVGSFSADGVFRLDGADASLGEVLEPSPQVQKDVVDAFVVEKALPTPTSPVAAMVGREPGGIGSALGPTSLAPENPLGRYPQGDLLGAASSADAVDHGISGAHRNIQLTSDQSESLAALIELTQWWYRDTFGNVQGPFSTNNMQEWFKNGFFPPDLEVKSSRSPNFEPLNMLILRVNNGIEPFAAAVAMSLAAPSMSQKSGPSPKPTGNGAPNPRVDTVAASASEASIGGQGTTLGGPTPSPDEVGVEPIPSLSQLMQYAFSGESVLQPASGSGGQAQPVNPSVQILQILEMHALKLSKYVSLQHHVSALRTEANQKLVQIMFAYEDQLRQFDLQGALTQEVRAHLQQRFEILESQTRQHYEVEIQTATNTLSTLENSFDPLIRDALRQGGSEYALNLVQGQIQATRNSLILGQAPDPQQYQERQQQGDTAGASPDSPNEPTAQDLTDQLKSLSVVSEGPTAAPEEQVVDKSPEIFEEDSLQGVADKQPNIDSKDSLPKENKEDKQQQQQQQAAVQKSGPVKPKKKATNSAASATISPEKTGLSTPTSRQETKAEPAKPSVAPWNN